MSYKINYTDTISNPEGITVQDQSLNTDTDLVFVGRNFPGYSEFIGENFLHLLENFAGSSAPEKPVKGQLWYDTGVNSIPAKPQLKVFDGTNWTEAGSVKKGLVKPAAENSIVGDLWVDANNQQLYLFTGLTWILVGPQFNESSNTGFRAEGIIDSATNTEKIVISFFIEEKRILVISRYEFEPKVRLEGFRIIHQGLNLSSEDFNINGAENKFWGISEKASALIVNNATVAASSFLRSDTISTTNFQLNVRSGSGVNIGPGLETNITSSSAGTVIHQTNPGANITLRTTQTQGTFNNSVIISSDGKVGINKIPNETLDLNGNFVSSGTARILSAADSESTVSGALVVNGGVGVGGKVNIAGITRIENRLILGPNSNTVIPSNPVLEPRVSERFDIGTTTNRFRNVYAKNIDAETINGTFVGSFSGTLSGTASSLTNSVPFNITGDVTSVQTVLFNGTSGVTLNTIIGPEIISSKPSVNRSFENDEFLVYRATATPRLRRINKAALFSDVGTVPIGSIFPFAGEVAPLGYLFCDGSEQNRSTYPELFSVLGFRYRPETQLIGFQTFALPDLRGRFPVGREGMDNANTVNKEVVAINVTRLPVNAGANFATFIVLNSNIDKGPFQVGNSLSGTLLNTTSAPAVISSIQNNTPVSGQTTITVSCQPQTVSSLTLTNLEISSIGVTDAGGGTPTPSRLSAASDLGNVGGQSSTTLNLNQLPDHTHDLRDSLNRQYYAINSSTGPVPEPNVINGNITFTSTDGHLLSNSGGILATGSLGQPINITNPYLTVNYIIFTGRILP
jgi:microcystin-dependent protein